MRVTMPRSSGAHAPPSDSPLNICALLAGHAPEKDVCYYTRASLTDLYLRQR